MEAFIQLKKYLTTLPVLISSAQGKPLIFYLAVSENARGWSVLVQEKETEEWSVYFVSQSLRERELFYQKSEKVAFVVLTTTRRLRPNFQRHSIIINTLLAIKKNPTKAQPCKTDNGVVRITLRVRHFIPTTEISQVSGASRLHTRNTSSRPGTP